MGEREIDSKEIDSEKRKMSKSGGRKEKEKDVNVKRE